MSTDIKVPVLPESVTDATVATWHKQPGDAVKRDENLVDLETDKVMLEVPAPSDGVLEEIVKDSGATVTSDEVLGRVAEGEAPAAEQSKSTEDKPSAAEQQPPQQAQSSASAEAGGEDKLSPSAKRLVEEHGLDAGRIEGSGRGGRITKADVLEHIEAADSKPSESKGGASKPAERPAAREPASGTAPALAGERPEQRVPMSRLRSRIAERMLEAKQQTAMLTSFNEVDLSAVMDIRKRYKETFEKTHGIRLGIMSFFVRAASEALKKLPVINASIDGKEIVYHGYNDIGIAVSTERGLVVPILRNAERMTLAEIEQKIADFAEQAREGTLALEDLQGGTFTITNGGVFGSLISTPIINPPQSAILGMHAIKERPVAVDGEVVARPMMYIALSYDHRLVDGRDAVLFLVAIKEALEDPARLLLDL